MEVTAIGPHGEGEAGTWPRVAAPDLVLGTLTRWWLDSHPSWPHVHGGALVDGTGRAVLVVGASGAGKSTLVANLAAAGFDLLSDEQVSLHRSEGLVGAFTRPVAVKPGGTGHLPSSVGARVGETGHTRLVAAEGLGTRHRVAARPALVVVPERDDLHARATTETLTPVEAVDVLAANNLDLARSPHDALSAFAWLACGVPFVRLRYREASDAVAVLRDIVGSPPEVASTLVAGVGRARPTSRRTRRGPGARCGGARPSGGGGRRGGGRGRGVRPELPPTGPTHATRGRRVEDPAVAGPPGR